jgi:hypothetical protein
MLRDDGSKVQGIFVALDSERDTPVKNRPYPLHPMELT